MCVYAWMNLTNAITIIILLKEVLFVSFIENWWFFFVFRRGNSVVGFTGEERSICRADEKCGQMSGNPPSGCHGVIRTLSDAKWSSGGLDLDKFYSIRFVKSRSNWKLQTLVLWCFRFHFLMHIWSLTSVEFNEHFWDMVKFSLVFIKKIFR